MKKYQYVVAAVCLCLSAMGFVGIYTTNQTKENNESAKNQQIVEESEKLILDSGLAKNDDTSTEIDSVADANQKNEDAADNEDATDKEDVDDMILNNGLNNTIEDNDGEL